MTLLLLGASGQLGTALLAELPTLGTVVPTCRPAAVTGRAGWLRVDLAQPDTLRAAIRQTRPQIIVNAAAYTAVDAAESGQAAAQAVNVEALALLAEEAVRSGALLVHFSTDYVFSGESTRPWHEQDPVVPLNEYGRSKAAGEVAILASGANHLILRTSWLYGRTGKNFVKTMLGLAQRRDEISVVDDQVGCPTSAEFVASATHQLLAMGQAGRTNLTEIGILHVACRGETSWHGFAVAIFQLAAELGLTVKRPQVRAIPSSEFPTAARRPSYSCLDTSKLEALLGAAPPAWDTELRRRLGEVHAQFLAESGGAARSAADVSRTN